jgi:hypothetical protein
MRRGYGPKCDPDPDGRAAWEVAMRAQSGKAPKAVRARRARPAATQLGLFDAAADAEGEAAEADQDAEGCDAR